MNWRRLAPGNGGELQRKIDRARWLRFGAYALHAIAGLLLVIYPLRTALETIAAAYTYAGAGLLLLGGLLCTVGTLMNRWSGEALGLPMCYTAYFIFGGVLLIGANSIAGTAIGLLFLGSGLWLADRWSFVMYMLRLVKERG